MISISFYTPPKKNSCACTQTCMHTHTHKRKQVMINNVNSWQVSQCGQYKKLNMSLEGRECTPQFVLACPQTWTDYFLAINICNHQRPVTVWREKKISFPETWSQAYILFLPLGAEVRVLDKAHFSSLYKAVDWIWSLLTCSKGFPLQASCPTYERAETLLFSDWIVHQALCYQSDK